LKNQTKAYILAIVAVAFWSTIATTFNLSLKHISFTHLLLYASLTSTLVAGVYLMSTGKLHKVFLAPPKQILLAVFTGILNPYLYYLILLKAYKLLPAQEAGTLNYFWPVVLVLLSIPLLKQKITLLSFAAILISFAGIVVISTHGNPLAMKFSNGTGVALALICPFIWAFFWILNMKNPMEDASKLFLNFLTGFVLILITVLLTDRISMPSIYGLIGSVYVGFFEMGITFLIWLKALKLSVTTARISNLVFLSPFISLIFIWLIIGEKILPSTIAGLILIVSGIILQRYTNFSKEKKTIS
jgi:drug/metabolite transporter (DMT)-like permease